MGDSVTLAICNDINRILLKLQPSFLNIKVVCAPLYNIMCFEIDAKYGKKKWTRTKMMEKGCHPYPSSSIRTVKKIQNCARGKDKECQKFTQIVIGTGRHEMISLSAEQYLQKLRLILPKIQGYLPLSKLMLIDVSSPRSTFDIKESSAEDDDECKLEEHKVECLSANAECRRFHQRYDIVDTYNSALRSVCEIFKFRYFSAYQQTEMVPSELPFLVRCK